MLTDSIEFEDRLVNDQLWTTMDIATDNDGMSQKYMLLFMAVRQI